MVHCPTWDAVLQFNADILRSSIQDVSEAFSNQFRCHRADMLVWRYQIGAPSVAGYHLRIRGPTGIIKRALNRGTLTLSEHGDCVTLLPAVWATLRNDQAGASSSGIRRLGAFCMECGECHMANVIHLECLIRLFLN